MMRSVALVARLHGRVLPRAAASAPSVFHTTRSMCTASVSTRREQAEKMTFQTSGERIAPRPVPTNARDYEQARRAYAKEVSALRKAYRQQWDARREVERAEAKENRRRVLQRKAENERLKSIRKQKVTARHARTRARVNAHAQYDRNYRLAARQAYVDRVTESRRDWLRQLEADSQRWIPEDKIDEMINEDTFAVTYPWHLEEWYARRHRRRQLQAARERGEDVQSGLVSKDRREGDNTFEHAQEVLRRAKMDGTRPDYLELLEGDETAYANQPDHEHMYENFIAKSNTAWESDDDLLDGFGSDWEEDVPSTNWFGAAERTSRTGVQLEEMYFQESMVDIKRRVDEFEAAHDAKFPLPDMTADEWAEFATDFQHGHWSEPAHLRRLDTELAEPHEAEAEARRQSLEGVSDDEM